MEFEEVPTNILDNSIGLKINEKVLSERYSLKNESDAD